MASTEGNDDFQKMKVIELKKILKEKGLPVGGTKDELIERLNQAHNDAAAEKLLEETGDAGVEAEGESIDEELEEEIMNEDATKVSSSNAEATNTAPKRKASEIVGEPDKNTEEPPSKKVEETVVPEAAESCQADKENSAEETPAGNNIVKLSTVTPEQKLDMRSKKFGLSEVAKKELRAKRFGISAPVTTTPTSKTGEKVTSVLGNEALKKRAQRFGIDTKSQALAIGETKPAESKPEDEEKKKLRAERFGIKAAPVIDTTRKISMDKANPILSQSQKERKLLRANRFRT